MSDFLVKESNLSGYFKNKKRFYADQRNKNFYFSGRLIPVFLLLMLQGASHSPRGASFFMIAKDPKISTF